jgi:hypothetical protein
MFDNTRTGFFLKKIHFLQQYLSYFYWLRGSIVSSNLDQGEVYNIMW